MPDTLVTRSTAATLVSRTATITAGPDTDARQFEGIAVPWDTATTVEWFGMRWTERFDRGALELAAGAVPIYVEHNRTGLPVGRIIEARDEPDGLHIVGELADTTAGRDLHAILQQGALGSMSIGFAPDQYTEDQDNNVTHHRATLHEVSVVGMPAYADARITAVRHHEPQDPKETRMTPEELAELLAQNEDLTRRLALLETENHGPRAPELRFRQLAEVVKALAERTATDAELHALTGMYTAAMERAATDSTASAITPAWIDRDVKLVDRGRPVWNLFRHESLPPEGMSIDYPRFKALTDGTADQTPEGSDLGLLKLELETAAANVVTSGNYAALTRQAIERASVTYLAKVLRAQMIAYAKHTNGKARTVLTGATGTNTATIVAGNSTAKGWVDGVVESVGLIDQNSVGLAAEFLVLGLHHYKLLAGIMDTAGRPVFAINGDGANTIGNVSATSLTGNVGGLPVRVDAGLTGQFGYVCSSEAITLLESPGAPFSLTEEHVRNLTTDFALYGYTAATLDDAKGIVKLTITAP